MEDRDLVLVLLILLVVLPCDLLDLLLLCETLPGEPLLDEPTLVESLLGETLLGETLLGETLLDTALGLAAPLLGDLSLPLGEATLPLTSGGGDGEGEKLILLTLRWCTGEAVLLGEALDEGALLPGEALLAASLAACCLAASR